MDGRRLLSVKDVMAYTGYKRTFVYGAISAGRLVPVRRPCVTWTKGRPKGSTNHRFRLAVVDAWLLTG